MVDELSGQLSPDQLEHDGEETHPDSGGRRAAIAAAQDER